MIDKEFELAQEEFGKKAIGLFVQFDDDEEWLVMSQNSPDYISITLKPTDNVGIGKSSQLLVIDPKTGKRFSLNCRYIDNVG